MKNTKKIFAVILSAVTIFSCLTFGAGALYADKDWEDYYASYMDEGMGILFQCGSDESERNLSWYSPLFAGNSYAEISENPDMSNAKKYNASFVITESADRSNKVTFKNLEEGKTYYYRCVAGDDKSEIYSFDTVKGNAFTAMYVTDIHVSRKQDEMENPLVHQSYTVDYVVNEASEKEKLDLVISAGDQASYGDRKEYESLVASPLIKSIPFSLCVGNHDRKGYAYKFFNNNPNKYKSGVSSLIGNDYWYVKGNVLFLVYDSNCKAASTHRTFTKKAIEANPDVKWRVAVIHHDMYGRLTSGRLEDSNENRRPVFVPIFDEFAIDLVLLGHSHYYTVSNVMYNGEVSENIEGNSVTDAKGSVYMVSGSINRPKNIESASSTPLTEKTSVGCQQDGVVYNLIDFSDDSIEIKSYNLDEDAPFNTLTINKTTQKGGHPDYEEPSNAAVERSKFEFLAVFTEFGEGIAGIWKTYFDS